MSARNTCLLALSLCLVACHESKPPGTPDGGIDADGYCGEMQVSFEPAENPVMTEVAGTAKYLIDQRANPVLTQYSPLGIAARSIAEATHPVLTANDRYYTLHGGVRSSDEVDVAFPPSFEHLWTAEPDLYLPEGPTFGDEGLYAASAYFFPDTALDYSLVSLDMQTGARRWKVTPGQTGQGGATLVLKDPATGGNVVYGGGSRAIFALEESGKVRWCRNTGFDVPVNPFDVQGIEHMFGINYHARSDTVVAIYSSGNLIAFDRRSGRIVARLLMPGAPAVPGEPLPIPQPLFTAGERAFRASFVPPGYELPEGYTIIGALTTAILGGGIRVANYYAMDPDSDLLWIASTLGDEADGHIDGQAEYGALYGIRLRNGRFDIHCTIPFEGGSASTPDVRPGGDRIYTSDAFGRVLAFDRDCRQLWATEVGQQVIGSLAVSSVGNEIYASTGQDIFKLEDRGDSGPIIWTSKAEQSLVAGASLMPLLLGLNDALDAAGVPLPASARVNNLEIAGIGENGVMVQSALGIQVSADNALSFLPVAMSMTLLDRVTGEVINATAAQEESVAVISSGQDGALYIGNSPIRRALLRGLLEPGEGGIVPAPLDPVTSLLVPPLVGGVSKYGPRSGFIHFVRDASCLAQRRLEAWQRGGPGASIGFPLSGERASVLNLLGQAAANLAPAFAAGELSGTLQEEIGAALSTAHIEVERNRPAAALEPLGQVCTAAGG